MLLPVNVSYTFMMSLGNSAKHYEGLLVHSHAPRMVPFVEFGHSSDWCVHELLICDVRTTWRLQKSICIVFYCSERYNNVLITVLSMKLYITK